jgi:hypothetical protein
MPEDRVTDSDPPALRAASDGLVSSPRRSHTYDPAFVALNRDMEAKFRRGEISFSQFDWHLRTMCGV